MRRRCSHGSRQGSGHSGSRTRGDMSGGTSVKEVRVARGGRASGRGGRAGGCGDGRRPDHPPMRTCRAFASAGASSSRSALFVVSCVAFLYIVLPKLAGFAATVHRIEGGDKWWIAVRRDAGGGLLHRLHRAVPRCLRLDLRSHRLARELRDHDGRRGRDKALRDRRRRRDRADGVGAAAIGDGPAHRRVPDVRLPGPALLRLRRLAADRRTRAWRAARFPVAARSP